MARSKERAAGAERAFLNYQPQKSKPDCRADAIDEMAVLAFDKVSCVLNNHEGACCMSLAVKKQLDSVEAAIKALEDLAPDKNGDKPCASCGVKLTLRPNSKSDTCDAAALERKAEDYLTKGLDNTALTKFEESLRCKMDTGVVKLAYMASCRAKNEAKAKLFFAKIPTSQQGPLDQICARAGIDVR